MPRIKRSRLIAFAVACLFVLDFRLQAAEPARPDPESPLATDNQNLYAIGRDRRTILVAKADSGSVWSSYVHMPPATDVRGLVWANGRLFVSDARSATIFAIATSEKDRSPVVVHRGAPLVKPTELTFTGELAIVDPGARALWRLALRASGTAPRRIDLGTELEVHDDTFVAGWATGELLIADGDQGLIAQVTALGDSQSSAKVWRLQQRVPEIRSPVQRNESPNAGSAKTVRRQGYARVEKPAAITTFNGIVYVIDGDSDRVFAAGIHDARPILLPLAGLSDLKPTRLIVTPVQLLALDAKTSRVVGWPRPVPAEIRYAADPVPGALAPVYDYLRQRRLLPTRTVPVGASIEETLRREAVIPRSGPVAPAVLAALQPTLCALNPTLCTRGEVSWTARSVASLLLPDFYAERYLTPVRVTLDNSQTLGEVVDAAISSDEFASFRDESYLRQANGVKSDAPALREARTGSFRISREQVRYLAAFDAAEIARGADYRRLVDQVRATLRILPLERVLTSAASAAQQHPNDPNCTTARGALAKLLSTIDYPSSIKPWSKIVTVAVAEKADVDEAHPDFVDAQGVRVFRDLSDEPTTPPPAAAPATNGSEPVEWRAFKDEDHGTAVASLIAGRRRPYTQTGPVSQAFITPIKHTAANELAQDIENAIRDSNTTVVNLSLKSTAEASALLDVIERSQALALFVAAAPNLTSTVELCSSTARVYPACWAERANINNLLVVGGTTLDGANIHPRSPIGDAIHVFAPESGYYAAGKSNGYVPVEGTSFATALVSSAAALLSGLGVESPADIKQRLIATANLMPLPNRPAWARVLDVRRAVSNLDYSVLTDANTGKERVVDVTTKTQSITFKLANSGAARQLEIRQIRRLTRDPTDPSTFNIAFIDDDGRLVLRRVRAPQTEWPFSFQPVDDAGQPVGSVESGDLAEYKDYVGPIK